MTRLQAKLIEIPYFSLVSLYHCASSSAYIKGRFPAIKSLAIARNPTSTNCLQQLTKESVWVFRNPSCTLNSSHQNFMATIDDNSVIAMLAEMRDSQTPPISHQSSHRWQTTLQAERNGSSQPRTDQHSEPTKTQTASQKEAECKQQRLWTIESQDKRTHNSI